MREIITVGKSLESIRSQISAEWLCLPEQLEIEVIEKAGMLNRSWKVKVILRDDAENIFLDKTTISWDGNKYLIIPGKTVEKIIPFPVAGKLIYAGEEIKHEYDVQPGSAFEFLPEGKQGVFTWDIQVWPDGSKAVAKVTYQHTGRHILCDEIPEVTRLDLEKYVIWESLPDSVDIEKEKDLQNELAEKKIIFGIKSNVWADFLTVDGISEIVVAEYTPPVQTIQPELIDFIGEPIPEDEKFEGKIDYFACKLRVCEKDEILARKIPGQEGIPGMNIFGAVISVEKLKDFNFKLKNNVYLSEDGLEIKAFCAGIPIRLETYSYQVDNAYMVNRDVDLSIGSINFPGDVLIGGSVNDGLYVYSGGKIQIRGAISSAEIKAETGFKIHKNIIASKIIIGEKHVFRSLLFKELQDINEELSLCITQVEQVQEVSKNSNVGPVLKIILEKKFPELPKKAEEIEKLFSYKDPELISEELEVAVRTIKHFLVGIGPLQLKSLSYLKSTLKIISNFLISKENLIPSTVVCDTAYVQNSEISCAGDFICSKGIYNSVIKVGGNTKIHGVCRGGELIGSGDIYIWELGGSAVSATTVRAEKNSRLTIEYCHSNVKIYVGKEIIRIDENVQKLDIYRDKGLLKVEKLKWDVLS